VRAKGPRHRCLRAATVVMTASAGAPTAREVYYLSGDGTIMPIKKDQSPPDLKYFSQAKK